MADLPVQSVQLLQFLQFLQFVLLPDSVTEDWQQPIVMAICYNLVARSIFGYWFMFAFQQSEVVVNRRQRRLYKVVCGLTGA